MTSSELLLLAASLPVNHHSLAISVFDVAILIIIIDQIEQASSPLYVRLCVSG